jgi:hypothetical protein
VTQFLILVAFGAMVWAVFVTILQIMACREIDALKKVAKENGESAKFYSDCWDRQDAYIHRLEKENARLGADLWLCRGYSSAKCTHIEAQEVR